MIVPIKISMKEEYRRKKKFMFILKIQIRNLLKLSLSIIILQYEEKKTKFVMTLKEL